MQFTVEDRRNFIGGSDIGVILGVNPWKTPLTLYLEKRGEIEPEETNNAMRWGTGLEGFLRQEASRLLGKKFRHSNKRYKHPDHPFLVAHIDGVCGNTILECKKTTSRMLKYFGPNGSVIRGALSGHCPESHYWQMQWYLMLTKKALCHYVVGIADQSEIRLMECHANAEDQQTAVQEALKFWTDLHESKKPEMVFLSDIEREHPKAERDYRDADEEDLGILQSYVAVRKFLEGAKRELAGFETQLKERISSHSGLIVDGVPVAHWSNQSRTSIDTKKLREDHPDLVNKYVKSSEYRAFRVSATEI